MDGAAAESNDKKGMMGLIRELLRPYRGSLAVILAAMLVQSTMTLAAPWPLKIVLDNDASGAQKKDHQTRMMGEIAKLVEGGKLGYLEPAAYERTVGELLAGKSDPVISKKPEGAFSHAIWEAAQK